MNCKISLSKLYVIIVLLLFPAPTFGDPVLVADPPQFGYCAGGEGVRLGVQNALEGVVYVLNKWDGSAWQEEATETGDEDGLIFFNYDAFAGQYRLEADDGGGWEIFDEREVLEFSLPDASITSSAGNQICTGQPVTLSAANQQPGHAYMWSPGGSTQASVSFSPNANTEYTLRITNSNGCVSSESISIAVNDLPVSYSLSVAGQGAAPYCTPVTIMMNGSEVGIEYTLLRDGAVLTGTTLTGDGGSLSFPEQHVAGEYQVRATNTTTGCSSIMNNTIEVVGSPASYLITPSGPLCEGVVLGLASSQSDAEYALYRSFNGEEESVVGFVRGVDGPLSFGYTALPGQYRVYARNDAGCERFFSDVRVVNAAPRVISLPMPHRRCAGSEILLENPEPGVEYSLYFRAPDKSDKSRVGNPVTAVAGQPVSFGAQFTPGVYTIRARNSENCESLMDGSITILARPQVHNVLPTGSSCEPANIRLQNSQSGLRYTLYLNNEPRNTIMSAGGVLDFGMQSLPGTYTIWASQDHGDELVCSREMNGSFELLQAPEVYTLRPLEPQCGPVAFSLNASESGVTYSLYRDASSVPLQSIQSSHGEAIVFDAISVSGLYHVKAEATNRCISRMTGNREVYDRPEAYRVTPEGSHCSNGAPVIGLSGSAPGVMYQLYRGNVAVGAACTGARR